MKLLKLHGSLSWRYTGPDGAPGDLIYETAGLRNVPFKWDANALVSPPDLRKYFSDLDPMIVPPAAVKSPYYSNKILQANWKIAAKELTEATELVMMGFSLPPTDLIVSSMLATTLPGNSSITPVNRSNEIVKRIRDTFQIPLDNDYRIHRKFVGTKKKPILDPIQKWIDANVPNVI
jgi:hypothetical protein